MNAGRPRLPVPGLLAFVLTVVACLGLAAVAGAATLQVKIVEPSPDIQTWGYQPSTINANVGDTITWTNTGQVPHTVTAIDNSFDSGIIAAGASWSYVATRPGTFSYICTLHPTMKGTLVVAGAAGAAFPIPATPVAPPVSAGPTVSTIAQAAPTARPTARPVPTSVVTTRPAPRAGGFPIELAYPLLGGGVAALGGAALLLRRGRKP